MSREFDKKPLLTTQGEKRGFLKELVS